MKEREWDRAESSETLGAKQPVKITSRVRHTFAAQAQKATRRRAHRPILTCFPPRPFRRRVPVEVPDGWECSAPIRGRVRCAETTCV